MHSVNCGERFPSRQNLFQNRGIRSVIFMRNTSFALFWLVLFFCSPDAWSPGCQPLSDSLPFKEGWLWMVMTVDPGVSRKDALFSVCETTEATTCRFFLVNAFVERDSGGERGRKDREMIATGVSATPRKCSLGGTRGLSWRSNRTHAPSRESPLL